MIKLKTGNEIDKIRESCRMLAGCKDMLGEMVGEGVSTWDMDIAARAYIEERGGVPAFLNYHGYPASICTSVNHVVIHGIPDKKKLLRNGDIISIDMGINLNGYFSDMAATWPVGEIDPEIKKLLRVTQECLDLGISQASAGNRIKDISRAVYNHALSNNYGVVHQFCGHGVGFELHEDPQIPNYIGKGPNPRIKPGMVLAIEPMINIGTGDVEILDDDWTVETRDKSISAHYEHTVAVFSDHTEILTLAG